MIIRLIPFSFYFSKICLKNAFCKTYAIICERFYLYKGDITCYVNRIKVKFLAKRDVQIARMIFKTHSTLSHPETVPVPE